jgi:hypothetical protein
MVVIRALAVWLVLLVVESIHGTFRRLVLEPWMGDFSARQISVFTGSMLILITTYLLVDWIRARTARQLTLVGAMWLALTFAFEIGIGRAVLNYSWTRVLSDFDLLHGGLLGIGLVIMGLAPRMMASLRRVKASRHERRCVLPGDELIPKAIGQFTHAINIHCSRAELWPWMVQMGAGRAGWYSYDFLDNGGHPSAEKVQSGLQSIALGQLFPALPGVKDGFNLIGFKPERFLILAWRSPNGAYLTTWSFVLEDAGQIDTRLIVRARGGPGYRFHHVPWFLAKGLVRFIHFTMERKQLLEIARRAACL